MKHFFQVTLATAALASFFSIPALADPDKSEAVARVFEVTGNSFQFHHDGKDDWKSGKVEMPGFVKDHFKTDGKTVAGLELLIGGRVGLKENTEIEILNEGEAGTVEGRRIKKIVLKSGGLWAKFAKQDKPLTIQTRGGVMGIKGTEFVVETQEDGASSVTLLEGQVGYQDRNGQNHEIQPGQKLAEFDKDDNHYCIQGKPSEVDQTIKDIVTGVITTVVIDVIQSRLTHNFYSGLDVFYHRPPGTYNASNYNRPGYMPTPDYINPTRSFYIQNFSPGLRPSIGNFSSAYVPAVPNWANWSPVYIPWNIPRVNIPGIHFP